MTLLAAQYDPAKELEQRMETLVLVEK